MGGGESRREKQKREEEIRREAEVGSCVDCVHALQDGWGLHQDTCPQGVPAKFDLDSVLKQDPGGFGRKEQTCGDGAEGLGEAGRLLSGLLGLMEPAVLRAMGPHQLCGATGSGE